MGQTWRDARGVLGLAVILTLLWAWTPTLTGAQRHLAGDRAAKFKFEQTTVRLPSLPNTDVTIVPEASGALTIWFEPPVLSVTGEWFTPNGKFTACDANNNCVENDEVGGPDVWYGGVGIGDYTNGGRIERIRFAGGADFNIFSVIE